MLTIHLADDTGLRWAQGCVAAWHYLHAPVDARCSVLAYIVTHAGLHVGCLIFGRPEATCCYDPTSRLTYGSYEDVIAGRCQYDRWEVVNLARVWLDPIVQKGGALYVQRAASTAIKAALARVGYDYLVAHPPVDCTRPYQLRVCLSYCDTTIHTGYLYRVCRFKLARANERGVQTFTKTLPALTPEEDRLIRHFAQQTHRSRVIRSRRAVGPVEQLRLEAV